MTMKKIPLRRCVVSNESLPKKDLLRIVKTKEGKILVDVTGKVNGHGTYLKKSREILELAKKRKSLEKALQVAIPDSIYEDIAKLIDE